MKKTKITIRAYCNNFSITINKKNHMCIEEATNYVKKEIIDTAEVISVSHLHEEGKEDLFFNPNFKDPTKILVNIPDSNNKYLKNRQNGQKSN